MHPRTEPAGRPARPTGANATHRRLTITAADGVALSVLYAEPAPGTAAATLPPVLALHGFASSAESGWARTGHVDALTRAGRTVIAPDLRGHGESGKPHDADRYTLARVLDDVVAAWAAATGSDGGGHRPSMTAMTSFPADDGPRAAVDLLGYSLGARLSWTLAGRGLLPVRRMVLGGFDGRPLFDGVDTERLDALAAGVAGNDRVALRMLVAGLAGTGGTPDPAALPTAPTLIAAGDRDPLATRAEAFARSLPCGAFVSVPGRNHISAVPAKVFRRGAVDFLADDESTSPVQQG